MAVLVEIALVICSVLFLLSEGRTGEAMPMNPHTTINDPLVCRECHDSYRDEVDGHEFVVGITESCESCHNLRDLDRSHPYDVDPRYSKVDVKIPDELPLYNHKLTCGTCHDPHLSYLSTVKSFRTQEAKAVVEVAYYQTFYTRKSDPVHGFDPLCDSCHHLL